MAFDLTGISFLTSRRLRVYTRLLPVKPSKNDIFSEMLPPAPSRPSGGWECARVILIWYILSGFFVREVIPFLGFYPAYFLMSGSGEVVPWREGERGGE